MCKNYREKKQECGQADKRSCPPDLFLYLRLEVSCRSIPPYAGTLLVAQ